jgi:hypothetical protein
MRTVDERREVNKWIARGASDYVIADITGVPRRTVQHWRHYPNRGPQSPGRRTPWRPPHPAPYAYLLGLYLGDGCLNPKGSELMIALDARYPGIVGEAEEAIHLTVPGVTLRRYGSSVSTVSCSVFAGHSRIRATSQYRTASRSP